MKAYISSLQQRDGDLLTTKEVALLIRVSPVTVQRLAAAGKFPGALKRNGKQYLIPRKSVNALLQPN